MSRPVVVIEAGPGPYEAIVRSPFEARDLIKLLPRHARRWDPDRGAWIVATSSIAMLRRLLADDFHIVEQEERLRGERRQRTEDTGTWADAMYGALGKTLGDKAHKALARVLHPDHGGDLEAMKALNAARDRAVTR